MRRLIGSLVATFVLAVLLAGSTGTAWANPPDAPGAGDFTDTANQQLLVTLSLDVPVPSLLGGVAQGGGLANNFTLAEITDPNDPISHAVYSNPVCGDHAGH